MKEIPLTKDKIAIVDDDLFDYLNQWKWLAAYTGGGWYARRLSKEGRFIGMHRVVMNAPSGLEVDHINGNGLDNRRENLRLCTHSQNMRNQKKREGTRSAYKGVGLTSDGTSWRARIVIDYRRVTLGNFDTEEDAAITYNHAALEYFGEFAAFNDIPGWRDRTPVSRSYADSLRSTNTSGFVGVSWNKQLKKWQAYIRFSGRRIHLGFFPTAEEAARARSEKAQELAERNAL